MITNIFIGSGLTVGDMSTFYSGINSSNNISVTNITFTANELNFNPTFSINTEDDNLIIYNENNSTNIMTINYSNNNVEMIKLINSFTVINVTSITYGFQMIGNPYTNSATQLSFYNDSTLEWLIGPNYTGGRGGGLGLNDFLFFNNNLAYNMIVAQYEQPYVDFNQNLYVYGTFSANTITCTNLTISSYSTINELNTNIISAQQVICMPTDQGAGVHIYGDSNYSAELAFLNQSNEKIWEVGASGSTFFIYNNTYSSNVLTIEAGTTPTINLNGDVTITGNFINSGTITVESNLYATGTSNTFTQLTISPTGSTVGLEITGNYLSYSATQIFFYGNVSSTEPITNFWQLGPNFTDGLNGIFFLWNNSISVNQIEVDPYGTFINFYGSSTGMTMTVQNDVVVTGLGYINYFNLQPVSYSTYSMTYTFYSSTSYITQNTTVEYMQIGYYIAINLPYFAIPATDTIGFEFYTPTDLNSNITTTNITISFDDDVTYYIGYFNLPNRIFVKILSTKSSINNQTITYISNTSAI